MYRLIVWLGYMDVRWLALFMFMFTIGKLGFNLLMEGRLSFGSLRFLMAYFGLMFDRHLTVDKFVLIFLGYGVIF